MCCRSPQVKDEHQYRNGDSYTGKFNHRKQRTGFGVYRYQDGAVYEGNWVNDKKHGAGSYRLPNGSTYRGEFQNGYGAGMGVGTWSDGSRYEGTWWNDKPHGQGTKVYPNGRRYTGEFQEGRRSGKGICTYRSPALWEKYDGQWLEDVWHGDGTCTFANGDVYKGNFARALFHGRGVLQRHSERITYDGSFVEGHMHGEGTWRCDRDGMLYIGEFQRGMWHGRGVLIYPDGRTCEGQWVEGRLEGPARMTQADGAVEECFFVGGVNQLAGGGGGGAIPVAPHDATGPANGDLGDGSMLPLLAATTVGDATREALFDGAQVPQQGGGGRGGTTSIVIPDCEICLETFDAVNRKPCVCGTCGKSICEQCTSSIPSCPFCRAVFRRTANGGTVGYVLNRTLMQMIES